MKNKVGVFIDITDLYYKLLRTFKNGKLDYEAYLANIKELTGKEFGPTVAYGCQSNNEASSFIGYLKSLGFQTKYKKPYVLKIEGRDIKRCNWTVGMCVDVFDALESCDTIVLCSSNPDMIPLVKYLKSHDIEIIIYACNVPGNLRKVASQVIEITKGNLDEST